MEPYAFNPHTFGRMLPWVDSKQSVTLFQEMRTVGLLDEQGYPVPPPYANQTEWYSAQRLRSAVLQQIHCFFMEDPLLCQSVQKGLRDVEYLHTCSSCWRLHISPPSDSTVFLYANSRPQQLQSDVMQG